MSVVTESTTTFKGVVKGMNDKSLCVDCGKPLTGGLALPCTRQEGDDIAQCPDCFDTFAAFSMEEITMEEVIGMFIARRIANYPDIETFKVMKKQFEAKIAEQS